MYGTRERIIDAAFDLFSRRGYNAISTSAIARRAHVNQSTLFRTFHSKEAIAKSVMVEKSDPSAGHSVAAAVERCDDIAECVRMVNRYFAHVFTPKFVRFQMALALELPAAVEIRTAEVREAFMKFIVRQQEKKKMLRINPVNATRLLVCAIYGLAIAKGFQMYTMREPALEDANDFAEIWIQGMLR